MVSDSPMMFAMLERHQARWAMIPTFGRISALSVIVLGLWLVLVGPSLAHTPFFGYVRGGSADWLVVQEAWTGGTPYAGTDTLAERHFSWEGVEPDDPHPRPPSALVLMAPLRYVSSSYALYALAVFSSIGLSYWVVASAEFSRLPRHAEFLVIPAAVITPTIQGVVWGSHVPLVAAALGLFLVHPLRPAIRGLGLALASGLKLFPALLGFADRTGRIRTLVWTLVFTSAATLAGLALDGVNRVDSLAALTSAPLSFGASDVDLSINAHLGLWGGSMILPIVGVIIIWCLSNLLSPSANISLALLIMVLFAPFAWPEYMVLWVPCLMFLWRQGHIGQVGTLVFLATAALTFRGLILMVGGLLLCALVIGLDLRSQRREHAPENSATLHVT